jgi:tRNA1(Val) A37 N6-methylase TrmN6
MMNPPVLEPGRGDRPDGEPRAAARVEGAAELVHWIGFAVSMLRQKGTVTLIHRADRLADVLAALSGRAGEIVIFPLWPRTGEAAAKRILIRARRGVAGPLRLARGLVLHADCGGFTPQADAVLRGRALVL